MSRLVKFFNKLYSPKYLLWTNVVTGPVFLCAGDFIEQKLEMKFMKDHNEFNIKRNVSMTLAGGCLGLSGHYWYQFLDNKFVGRSKRVIIKKLLCEMAIGPPFAAAVFIFVGKLESRKLIDIWNDLKDNILFICIADWFFYIPLQAVNFYILPPKYRLLYVGTISLFYDIFFSFILHRN